MTTPDGNDVVVIVNCPSIVIERVFVAVRCAGFVESVTVIVTVLVVAVVGVPLICPVDASRVNPAGSPVADQVYGVAPPVAASVTPAYAVFTTPDGSDVVVIANWPAMLIDSVLVALRWVGLVESVTVIVTVLDPAVVGAPVIAPLEASMLRPAGRPVADHVYGVVPPVAATVALYAVPTTPPGNDVVVMDGGAMIVIERLAVAVRCVGLVESVTVTTAVLVPAIVGVPLIAPLEALMVKPAGNPVADQV